jgi:hypothetical protein
VNDVTELHARLLADARRYDPTAHHRGLLAPYRDVLLVWRAKFMSYEQIAAALGQHGIRVSPAGVGVFCRRTFSKAELNRARQEHLGPRARPEAATSAPAPARPVESSPSRRGPKVARDDY